MAIYYVGPGGNDTNDGLSWANRFLTLNGAEDEPVVAGDTVYVGPGVYRELLTTDVAGSSGNPITFIGDWTGENTDGIGGIVRITGSNDDLAKTRSYCIDISSADNYRTFRGFYLDSATASVIRLNGPSNIIIEDCYIENLQDKSINIISATQSNITIRRCFLVAMDSVGANIVISHSTTVDNTSHLIENCIIIGGADGVSSGRVGGVTVKNCFFLGQSDDAVDVTIALSIGQTMTVNNCIFMSTRGVEATTTAEFSEDYNWFATSSTTYRNNVNTGANSVDGSVVLLNPLPLLKGFNMNNINPYSEWTSFTAKAGTGESADDLFGMTRPTTSAKKSWGPIQYADISRETTTVDAGSASLKLADAGRVQFKIPVTNTSTTFAVEVYREANYAGTNPQMVIKQPGQADDTTTDAGSASTWNSLTTTLTPASTTDFVVMELVSNNTATSGSYDTFFDTISVT